MAERKPAARSDRGEPGRAARAPIHVVGAAILRKGRVLAARRGPGMALAGRWELPGGKVEARERPEAALRREIREELGVSVDVGEWLGRGESIEGGRRIVLDVFEARLEAPEGADPPADPRPREHDRLLWLESRELLTLDWAEADVPLLPALAARLRGPEAHRLPPDTPVLSADWAKRPRKRAVYVAEPGPPPTIARAELPQGGWTLRALVERASRLAETHGRPAALGIDAAIGVPAAFGRRLGLEGFPKILEGLERSGALRGEASDAEGWSPQRPFFRVPAGAGGLTRFFEAAGGRTTLLRQIELRTGAKPVFVTSGIPGSVGSGSRALWQELAEARREGPRLALWPFEGSLAELARGSWPILAETYPRASYALALEESLPARPKPLAKTRAHVRADALARLRAASWVERAGVRLRDLEAAFASEDDFDALLTAAALTRMLVEERPLSCELVDPLHEGGILGTGEIAWRRRPRRPRQR